MKESAEIYEYLSELPEITEKYDQDYLVLLSALCYDLSGYQANAYCIARRMSNYFFKSNIDTINLEVDNIIIEQITQILLKNIPFAYYRLNLFNDNGDLGFILFKKALITWYEFILQLREGDFISQLDKVYNFYLNKGNVYISHIVLLLKIKILLFSERSVWNVLREYDFVENNNCWRKYVKLLSHDFYSDGGIKDIEGRVSIFEFWTSQLRALESGLIESDENYVVQMPTSAGKTFIAELAILKYLINYPEKKCIYIAPFRALISEKENELRKYLSKLGFNVSSLSGNYEVDEFQNVFLSEADLIIATPEKIDLLLRTNPELFSKISFVVVDEGHIIGDQSARATLLEFLIIRLKIKIPDIKTLFISAVMPSENANEYALWLSGKENNVIRSLMFKDSKTNEEWEPTRKLIGSFIWDGNNGKIIFKDILTENEKSKISEEAFIPYFLTEKEFGNKFPKKNDKLQTTGALAYKLSLEGNTLVFCSQPRQTEWIYKRIRQIIDIQLKESIPEYFRVNKNNESFYYAMHWYGEEHYVTQAIKYGIGIHFGDMPRQVRNAIESDFREGKLKILLSSNTIGQGLNLPIKNIVIYSLCIGKQEYIKKRDFWNIIGRAGRAGKETEGKIIFVINSYTDWKLFNEFSNKENIESANSLVFTVLNTLETGRINEQTFDSHLSILSETYLLDLLTEEIIGTEYEKIIQEIINNSLFKIQIDKRDLDIEKIKNGFHRIFKKFEQETTIQQLKSYKLTGLSFNSNLIIDNYIDSRKQELQEIISNDNYLMLLDFFLKMITECVIEEFRDPKLNKIISKPNEYSKIIKNWISGEEIQDLRHEWIEEGNSDHDFDTYMARALYYSYPWGITSFISILSYKMEMKIEQFPKRIKNLATYVKYGLNNPTSCLARSVGIKSRQASIELYEKSEKSEGKDFIRWLSNLTYDEIDSFNLLKFDKENILSTSLSLTNNSYRNIPSVFRFRVKGTYYNEEWRLTSKKVRIDEELMFIRDINNKFDPYAILIVKGNKPIGYIPREYSRILSAEIDIEKTNYRIVVSDIMEKEKYNEIILEMNEIN